MISFDTAISTLVEEKRIKSSVFSFSCVIYSLIPTTVFIVSTSLDMLLVSFLHIERLILRAHSSSFSEAASPIISATPFPQTKVQFFWPDILLLRSHDIRIASINHPIAESRAVFLARVEVPRSAGSAHEVIKISACGGRNVLLPLPNFKVDRRQVFKRAHDLSSFAAEENEVENEIEKIRGSFECSEFSISLEQSQEDEDASFRKSGNEHFIEHVRYPAISAHISEYVRISAVLQNYLEISGRRVCRLRLN